ncbi:MAG: hypothetical protein MAG453_02030 [Calditrichaeota bacterium]|nr:hypothetical protein [Calditrichota bacterium]
MSGAFQLDWAGVGAAKAGTSWTAAILGEHPEICVGKGKELDYFLENMPEYMRLRLGTDETKMRPKGLDWLQQQFDHCRPGQLKGEISPRYLSDPGSPRLLHEHNPDIKLVFNFRNPTEAAYSYFHHYSAFHPVEMNFEQALDNTPEGAEYFKYIQWIEHYLEYFPRDNIHFILMDDIRADSRAVYHGLCRFLGVEAVEVESLIRRVNTSKQIRSKALLRAVYGMNMFVGRHASTRWLRDRLKYDLGFGNVWFKIKQLNLKREKYPPLTPETRDRLLDIYRDSNRRLGEFLDRDLGHWNDPATIRTRETAEA